MVQRIVARSPWLACALGLLLVFAAAPAWASGVEIQEQGRGLGNAFAGAQAEASDASTIWWNPAGMTRIRRHQVSLSGFAIRAYGDFVDAGSFRAPGLPYTGEEGRTDEVIPVGSLYATYCVNRKWKVGLGVNAPFGLVTDWGETWIGRYYATRSELTTININPSVAYQVNKCLSVGVGFNAMYAKAELGNAVDFGAALQAPQAADGQVEVEGSDWGFGYNVGLLFEPSPCTRVGLHYRSRVNQKLAGTAEFSLPAAAAPLPPATGRFIDTDAYADVMLPDQIGLGIAHDLNRKWTLLGSVFWTNWSLFKDLRVRFANPAEPDAVTVLDWDDTWRVAVGAIFRPNDRWSFRVGTQWDQSPIPDSTRTPRIPMNDRIWAAVGVGFRITRAIQVDVSYAHVFVQKGNIDLASPTAGFLDGHVDGATDIFGLTLVWDL